MAKSSEPCFGRQQRQLSAISEYTTDIPTALSRAVTGSVHLGLDYAAMAEGQTVDSEVQAYRTAPTALLMEDVVFDTANATLLCDVSTGRTAPHGTCWLEGVRFFDAVHGLSHPGVKASTKLVGAKFVWPGLGCCLCGVPAHKGDSSYQGPFGTLQSARATV